MWAAAGVRCAPLPDHDRAEGGARFADSLARRGILCLTGIELTAPHRLGELHLLALGFRPAALRLGPTQRPGLARAIRSAWTGRGAPAAPEINDGAVTDLISRVHDAGGPVYLAHPLMPTSDLPVLDRLLG